MPETQSPAQKITISIPADLLAYADAQASRLNTSRSRYISQILEQKRASELERLAAEGYGFYASESSVFAEESGPAFAEALDGDTDDDR